MIMATNSSSLNVQYFDVEVCSSFLTPNCSNLEIFPGLEQNHRPVIDPLWFLNEKSLNLYQDVFPCSKEGSLIPFVVNLS